MALKIEYVPVGDLREYERNARTHDVDQVAQIAASIREFGFTNPVLIDENNELIAGHGRTQAAISIGLNEVPAIRLEGLSDEKKRALRIADNQLALNSGWDLELLSSEIQGLDLEGIDLEILGFDDEFLSGLIDGVGGGPTNYDATPTNYDATPTRESHADHAASAPKPSEQKASFADKNKELDVSTFDDEMDLKIRLSFDDYHEASRRLREIDESLPVALKKLLGMVE